MHIRNLNKIALLTLFLVPQIAAVAHAQTDSGATIKAETNLVLVDTVVTDKHGAYVRDLTQKDFKVWEDGKEQPINSFSLEDDSSGPSRAQIHYMVLFFDNSTMEYGDQLRARDAAVKFLDANTADNRLIAIAEFDGTLHITQNFTSDADRLKAVANRVRGSSVSPNAPAMVASLSGPSGAPSFFGNAEADFGANSMMLALRNLAKGLASVPGRKTVVMLTAGFPLTPERQSELTAVVDACNKANVAVYPIDVRGLTAPGGSAITSGPSMSRLQMPSHHYSPQQLADGALINNPQQSHPTLMRTAFILPASGGAGGAGGGGHGGGGGAGGGRGGGGTTGGTGGGKGGGGTTGGGKGGGTGTGGGNPGSPVFGNQYNNPAYTNPRTIVPPFPDSASNNQQLMYALAEGTGGFVILNSNDLLGGMEKIAKEEGQYYLLGYKPPDVKEGACHSLKVKVDRGGTSVRSRSGYCDVRPADILAGTTTERDLETRATHEMPGNVTASMQAPFFYTAPNVARVNLAIDIPSNALKFEKVKGKQHTAINVLGIAYKPDDSVAARFSDTVNLDFEGKKEVEDFQKQPFHYQNQFEVASGQYKLRVVFSSGNESFGKIESPLNVDAYSGKKLSMSALVISRDITPAAELATGLDAELLEDKTPLVSRGMQFTPSADNHFKKTDKPAVFLEVYEPLLTTDKPPKFGLEFKITDLKSGQAKVDAGVNQTQDLVQKGSPVVPIGLMIPVQQLGPGSYKAELRAQDSVGNTTNFRAINFDIE
jgi:VWFA-related protein